MKKEKINLEYIGKKTSPKDGSFISHYCYRFFSKRITLVLSKTNITPETIIIFELLIGIIGSILFLFHTYLGFLIGVGLLLFRHILDCVDGEIARLKNLCSSSGAFFDLFNDRLIDVIMFLCLGLGLWFKYNLTWVWIAIFLAFASQFILATSSLKIESINKSLKIEKKSISKKKIFRRMVQYGDDMALMLLFIFALFNGILYGVLLITILSLIFSFIFFFYHFRRLRLIDRINQKSVD